MKKIMLPVLLVIIEVVMCVGICLSFNTHKYDSWIDTEAEITRANDLGGGNTFLMFSYNGWNQGLEFRNYSTDLKAGDTVNIKVNELDDRVFVYIPYKQHIIFIRRWSTAMLTALIIAGTVVLYKIKFGKREV